jgi:hypothetical protein
MNRERAKNIYMKYYRIFNKVSNAGAYEVIAITDKD